MGGFVTDETGKVVMHINSPDILTQESIDFWEKEYGAKLYCSKCGKRLQPGDQKDHTLLSLLRIRFARYLKKLNLVSHRPTSSRPRRHIRGEGRKA